MKKHLPLIKLYIHIVVLWEQLITLPWDSHCSDEKQQSAGVTVEINSPETAGPADTKGHKANDVI